MVAHRIKLHGFPAHAVRPSAYGPCDAREAASRCRKQHRGSRRTLRNELRDPPLHVTAKELDGGSIWPKSRPGNRKCRITRFCLPVSRNTGGATCTLMRATAT